MGLDIKGESWRIKSEYRMSWTFTTLKSAIQDYTQNTESTFVADLVLLFNKVKIE